MGTESIKDTIFKLEEGSNIPHVYYGILLTLLVHLVQP